MGQKVNPHGLRVGVIKDWSSKWYVGKKDFGDVLVSDYKLRTFLKEKLFGAGVSKIDIERNSKGEVKVTVFCAKPGMIIGKGGTEIEKLRQETEAVAGVKTIVDVKEVKPIDLDAQLVAESICNQLERRIAFRRAMKQAIGRTMRLGANGIKVSCSGRLAGAEIARTEHYHEGTIPLQTLRADIDYGFWEANTTYGKIGVKVWIYKGEVLSEVNKTTSDRTDRPRRKFNKDDKGEGRAKRAPRAPKKAEGGEH